MRTSILSASASAIAVLLIATAAEAKWTEKTAAARAPVAQSRLSVVAPARWNQWSARLSKKSETWSYDGPLLNRIDFYANIATGEPLTKERNKKREPLPKFAANMQASDIAELYERTNRIAANSNDFTVDTVSPAPFAGRKGFRFSYHYTAQDDTLTRKGIASGAIVEGKLYLITFTAPSLYYFDTGLTDAQAIMDSASLG
jgi:hypothetical protein